MTTRVYVARTHPPEYQIHKYWSRKPANVIASYLHELLPEPSVVIDPYCGSGVLLREASVQGHSTIGMDVNPIAVALSEFTSAAHVQEPDYTAAANNMLHFLETQSRPAYTTPEGRRVDYVVHEVISACKACGASFRYTRSGGTKRVPRCPACDAIVRFNLNWLVGTEVVAVKFSDEPELVKTATSLEEQQIASSKTWTEADQTRITQPLVENTRTLTYEGFTTADYFTPRNHSLLAALRAYLDSVRDPYLQQALTLTVTATLAQTSKLIPFRGALTTGGPAWSVPGFWIPPIHLETNPSRHLEARVKKFRRGISSLQSRPSCGEVRVLQSDAERGLKRCATDGVEADLVFLDPPYGDSVAFGEFSVLWNAFLTKTSALELDISVSNRTLEPMGWDRYASHLTGMCSAIAKVLSPRGRILVTFNNHDERAWTALLGALHGAGFYCQKVDYQIPAVVSAKAQFSPDASYLGDLYVLFAPEGSAQDLETIMPALLAKLQAVSASRGGRVSESLARRTVNIFSLENNLNAKDFGRAVSLIPELFHVEKPWCIWKGELASSGASISDLILTSAREHLQSGASTWSDIYAVVAAASFESGMPDMKEVRTALEPYVIESANGVRLKDKQSSNSPGTGESEEQLDLFGPQTSH